MSVIATFGSALVAGAACSTTTSLQEGNDQPGYYAYCEALAPTCNALYTGGVTACSQAARDQCGSLQATHSQAFQDAVVDCAKTYSPCIGDYDACITTRTGQAAPSAVQTKVKDAFCAICPDAKDPGVAGLCSTFFETSVPDGGAAGVYGVGSAVMFVSDAVAEQILTTCLGAKPVGGGAPSAEAGAPACDAFGFAICANRIRQAMTTPSACQADGGR